MSFLILRPSTGTAGPDGTTPTFPSVPVLHARIAWRTSSLTILPWDGSVTTGWTTDGSLRSGPVTSLAPTSSDSFGGGSSYEVVTAGTAASGIDYALTGTFTSGRTYRLRAGVKRASGSTSLVLRLGNAADAAASTAVTTTGWAWYTVDWTPSGDRTDAVASLRNGAAATQTTRLDHVEVYEADDDVTLQSLTTSRGGRFDGGGEPPGTIGFDILDPSAKYTPRNSASPLYGTVRPGRKVHIRVTYGGRLYPVAYGVLRSVTPDPWSKLVTFTAEDGLRELAGYSITRAFASDLSYRAARAAALAGEALAATMHDLATDSVEASLFYDGTDASMGLLDYLQRLNEATGTVHVCVPHNDAARPWRYTTITRPTLTDDGAGQTMDDDLKDLSDVDVRDESLMTRQRVGWHGYDPRPSVVVASTSTEGYLTYTSDDYGTTQRPVESDIYRIVTTHGQNRRVGNDLRDVDGQYVAKRVPLTIASGGTATEVVDFSWPMEGITADVTESSGTATVTLTTEPARATIQMVAAGGAVTVSGYSVSATPWKPLANDEEVVTTSGADVILEGSTITNEYIPSAGMASGLADYLTWRYGDARLRPTLVDQHQPVRQLTLDVGAHVTLSADRWYIDADRYVIRSVAHEVSNGGWSWITTYGLEELPAGGAWFTLDGGAALGIDSSAVLAH